MRVLFILGLFMACTRTVICVVHDSADFGDLLIKKQVELCQELLERSQSMMDYYAVLFEDPEVNSLLDLTVLTKKFQGLYAELEKLLRDNDFNNLGESFDPKLFGLITKSLETFFKIYLDMYEIFKDGLKAASPSKPGLADSILWKVKRTLIQSALSAEILCLKMIYTVISETGVFVNPIIPGIYYLYLFEKGLHVETANPTLDVDSDAFDEVISKYSISTDELIQRSLESLKENEQAIPAEDKIYKYVNSFRSSYKRAVKPLLELNGIKIKHVEL